ncbi:MAG: FHA domain-containing protein [Bacteroidales bacterium]|nr:FHA domain-containing protein [Bacteroidales bacterium]
MKRIKKNIYTIGRNKECDIVIHDNTDVISRLHATIRVESNGKIYLIDQSRNGTYVNGVKMSSNVEIPISRKDVVSFAHICDLDWSLVPKNKSNILKIVSVVFICFVLIGLIYVIVSYLHNKKTIDVMKYDTSSEFNHISKDNVYNVDTIVVYDTISIIKEKKQKEDTILVDKPKNKENEDTISAERSKEEIYNPIY